MKHQKIWFTKLFCFFAFFLSVLFLHPAEKVYAGTTSLTMKVGETKTVYPASDDYQYRSRTVRNGGGWINYGSNYIQILSDTSSKYSCKIKANKVTSSPVILRLDYYYLVSVGTYTYQASGYVDYKITVVSSGTSSTSSSSSHSHVWVDDQVIKANTCTTSGTMKQKCKYCTNVRYITLAKKGHSLQKIIARAATTTSSGNIEYWKCSTCGACFKDSSGKETISENSTILEKLTTSTSSALSGITSISLEYKIISSGSKSNKTVAVTGIKGSKNGLTNLVIGDTETINGVSYKITTIAAGAFRNCINLKSVTIGNNVKVIGQNSFSGCTSLTEVTIGSSTKKISKKAFFNCKKLKQLTIVSNKLKNVETSSIKNIYKKAVIKVPSGKVRAYKKLFNSESGFRKTMKIQK